MMKRIKSGTKRSERDPGELPMTQESNREYYERRERQACELAERANSPEIRLAHLRLAEEYRRVLDSAGDGMPRPILRIASPSR